MPGCHFAGRGKNARRCSFCAICINTDRYRYGYSPICNPKRNEKKTSERAQWSEKENCKGKLGRRKRWKKKKKKEETGHKAQSK